MIEKKDKAILIRMPENLHTKLRVHISKNKTSAQELILDLIKQLLNKGK